MSASSCDMKFIRELREKQGLSRGDLSMIAKVQEGTIRKIESGTTRIDLCNLVALRKALGLTWEALGRLIEREIATAESSDK